MQKLAFAENDNAISTSCVSVCACCYSTLSRGICL